MSEKNKLDFVVVGAQKCATTWLYDCLKDHPELNLRISKNEDIYYGSNWMKTNGVDKYFKQFNSRNHCRKGCVSVEYIEDKNAADTLYGHNPNIKIIVSLRKPELRALSAYQWYVRKAIIPDLPLNEGLYKMLCYYRGAIHDENSSAYINIIDRGLYAQKLKHWFEIFTTQQIKIQFFDEVQQNPRQAIADIFQFLETDPHFVPAGVATQPKKNTGISPLIKLQRRFAGSTVVGKIVDKSNQLLTKNKNSSAGDQIDQDILSQLREVFAASSEELKGLFKKYQPESLKKMETYWK